MMKSLLKVFSLLSALFFSIGSIDANTITWLGGYSSWGDASQWDTGTVPTLGDDVIIPSGYVRIYNGDAEAARSVEVQAIGRLYIYEGGELEISGAINNDGLFNLGSVYVYGELSINNITQTSGNYSAKAIKNKRRIFTYLGSQINIENVDDIAIYNDLLYSYFRASGDIWINPVNKTAIYNGDGFYNYGNIDIEGTGQGQSYYYLIINAHNFNNYSTGVINLSSNVYGGISNASVGVFKNFGGVNIDGASIGVYNSGIFKTYSNSNVEVENSNTTGFYNRNTGSITNNGDIDIRHSTSGIYNYGSLTNNNSLTVLYSGNNGAIRNFSSGVINNYDEIYLNATGSRDINNDGSFSNHSGSVLETNKIIEISSTGRLLNYGFLISHSTINHIINGFLGNKGVIDDNFGTLQSYVNNDRVIVVPVIGPMYEGVPFPNVLDVSEWSGITIGDWKAIQSSANAGTYNIATNEFTPNFLAVGASTLYISFEDNATGLSRDFTLEINGGILPFAEDDSPAFFQEEQDDGYAQMQTKSVVAFPNPTTGNVQLKSELFENDQTEIQVFNTLGQLVQQIQLGQGGFTQTIDFSKQLTNGVYILKMLQQGNEVNVQRIQLQR